MNLQAYPISPDQILKITPASMAGYGLALAVLALVAYVFYKRWHELEIYTRARDEALATSAKDTIAILAKVELRLHDQKDMKDLIKSLITTNENILQIIQKKNQ